VFTIWFWHDPTDHDFPSWPLVVLTIPAIAFSVYWATRKNSLSIFAALWFAGTYLSLIATVLITDRVMFKFYLYPSIGAVCIALALIIAKLWGLSSKRESKKARWALRSLTISFLIGHLAVFIIMSPYTGLATP